MKVKVELKTTPDYRTLLVYEVLDVEGIRDLFGNDRVIGKGYEINKLTAYEVVNVQNLPYILRYILTKFCLTIENCKNLKEGESGQENSSSQNLSKSSSETTGRQRGRRKEV